MMVRADARAGARARKRRTGGASWARKCFCSDDRLGGPAGGEWSGCWAGGGSRRPSCSACKESIRQGCELLVFMSSVDWLVGRVQVGVTAPHEITPLSPCARPAQHRGTIACMLCTPEVCRELFSGDLYERLRNEPTPVRRVPLEFCQLDLCVTEDGAQSLEQLLDEHTRDVQVASGCRRAYSGPADFMLASDSWTKIRRLGGNRYFALLGCPAELPLPQSAVPLMFGRVFVEGGQGCFGLFRNGLDCNSR